VIFSTTNDGYFLPPKESVSAFKDKFRKRGKTGGYVARAEKDVALQLSRAGVRLAAVLNKALGRQVAEP
jgi:hypothetical protein